MSWTSELHDMLNAFAALMRPMSYLEVGVREGDSLLEVLAHCLPVRLYLCDNWGIASGGTGKGNHDHIAALLAEKFPEAHPTYLDGNSHVLLAEIRTTFQMITVDGDHSGPGAAQDLRDCWPLLEVNGFLFFDDIEHPQHRYLDDELKRFLQEKPDARLLRRVKYDRPTPGCAVVQKITKSALI